MCRALADRSRHSSSADGGNCGFLRLLQTGGPAAVSVPDGVLFGSSNAHRQIRKILVEDQKLQAVISMPSGVFKPGKSR